MNYKWNNISASTVAKMYERGIKPFECKVIEKLSEILIVCSSPFQCRTIRLDRDKIYSRSQVQTEIDYIKSQFEKDFQNFMGSDFK